MNNFYLGCDASKGFADFVLINEDKQTAINNFQLDDTSDGHQQLCKILNQFAEKHPGCVIYSAVESTGGYENNWLNTLRKLQSRIDIPVARVNPIGTNHNSKASMDRITTDKQAAKNIAEYLINHKNKIIYNKDDRFYFLRRQWKFVRTLVKQRTQLYNQLESILYIANPELLTYCKDGYPNWLLKVILQYPTAKHLSKARIDALTSIPYLKEDKALSLINKARSSVASAVDDITANLVISMVKQISKLTKLINKQSHYIADNCKLPEIEILKSFQGIGDYSALGLLLNICPIEYFESTKKISSFSGLHPIWKQSGDGVWGMHMSKQGRKEIRNILYMVARSALVHNPYIKEIYARQLKKGKKRMAAIGICMHKILRIVFGMLKNNEKFNPEKDRANSEKMLNKQNQSKPVNLQVGIKLRRYQKLDLTAPISKRQTKKRKEQEMSQNPDKSGLNTGSIPHSSK
ncbi:MAG TPA: IS110 family transposase [Ignavibacteriaceae bacterium]|nr:IS110 family transposase [Ignavibacteriaceae bacterium]